MNHVILMASEALIALALAVGSAGADVPKPSDDPILPAVVGQRVRLIRADPPAGRQAWGVGPRRKPTIVIGNLADVGHDVLTIASSESGKATLVPRATVRRLQVARGQQSMWRKGAAIGGTIGVLLGLVPALACAANSRACADDRMQGLYFAPLVTGAAGAAFGAVIGAPIRGDRWEDAPLPWAAGPRPRGGVLEVAIAVRWPRRHPDRPHVARARSVDMITYGGDGR